MNQNNPTAVHETLFKQADAYFEALTEAIDQARFQIDIEVYIYEAQALGQHLADALGRAARRGVLVRLMTDGAGIDKHFNRLAQSLIPQGVEFRVHRPLPWRLYHWPYAIVRLHGWRKLIFLLLYINRRNHRKMVLVDHQIFFVGSINVSQHHLSTGSGGDNWRDTAIRVEGLDFRTPLQAFEINWNFSRRRFKKKVAESSLDSPFLFNFTHRLRLQRDHRVIEAMNNACETIWITNAYFVPDRILLSALRNAAKRGVDVRILLPRESDVIFMPWVSAYFYKTLINAGARIYEYLPSMLHAKVMMIDDWCSVGSSNLNRRSWVHDLEVDYLVQTITSKQALKADFLEDIHQAELQTRSSLDQNKRLHIVLGAIILFLFGRWL